MKVKHMYKKIALIMAVVGLCASSTMVSAKENKELLANGELFTVTRVMDTGKVIYENKNSNSWVWQGAKGYPKGLTFSAFVSGKSTPNIVAEQKNNALSGESQNEKSLVQEAKTRYKAKAYANKLIIYGVGADQANNLRMDINKVELFGRLLNVTVALTNAQTNVSANKDLHYVEIMRAIALKNLPKVGNLRVRFVDMQGNALQVEDVVIGR